MNNILVNNAEKFGGQYVATKSFIDKEVICNGNDLVKVHEEAIKKGLSDPVVFFVPKKGVVQIY